jgi:hypothetical protein
VCLLHADAEEDSSLYKVLSYRADLVMKVKNFPSGYLEDLDGEVWPLVEKTHLQAHFSLKRQTKNSPNTQKLQRNASTSLQSS